MSLHDLHIPWRPIIATLRGADWSSWLSSEYEGAASPTAAATRSAASMRWFAH
jgi:sugar phosphate isomerase/epimerase